MSGPTPISPQESQALEQAMARTRESDTTPLLDSISEFKNEKHKFKPFQSLVFGLFETSGSVLTRQQVIDYCVTHRPDKSISKIRQNIDTAGYQLGTQRHGIWTYHIDKQT